MNDIKTNKLETILKDYKKKAFLAIVVFLINFLLPNIFSMLGMSFPIFLQMFFNLLVTFLLIQIFLDELKFSVSDFKKNLKKYLLRILVCTIIAIIGNTLLNAMIGSIFNIELPNNQLLNGVFDVAPLYFLLSVIFISPLMETLIIPVAFYNIVGEKKWQYILASSLVLGLFYVLFSFKQPLQLLFFVSYMLYGCIFCWNYYKTKNIFIPLIIKALLAIVMSLSYIMVFLGFN